MTIVRVALGNVRFPSSPKESIEIAVEAMQTARDAGAEIICFPESLTPGYCVDPSVSGPSADWFDKAWATIDSKAGQLSLAVVLGTERLVDGQRRISARVTNADGSLAGFQDKVQLDPSEEARFAPGHGRQIFECGPLKFGVVICHEGWRYPETVRWAASRGAQVVFHPHVEIVEDPQYRPSGFADPNNTFHEKAALCRAAENTCYFATVNCALPGSATTSAFVDPDGRLLSYQPHGQEGILIGEIDTEAATGLLAGRLRNQDTSQKFQP